MRIQMTDLGVQYASIKDQIDKAMANVIGESSFILGQEEVLFENEAAAYFGRKHAVGVASGTDALVLSLAAAGIGPGDEVVTTPFTFIATAEAISRVGARPVFCDIDEKTYNMDAAKLPALVTAATKAVLPVHLYGNPCDMDAITALASRHGLAVIEDCAQSFGSEYKGKKTGSFGLCGCLSFFPAKTLGCFGDGGMVVADDDGFVGMLKVLRNHGSSGKYVYSHHGFNSRLDTLQAALLRVKLRYVDEWIRKRLDNAAYYNEKLSGVAQVTCPVIPSGSRHSFNYYNLRVGKKRDGVIKALADKGIATAVYYPLCLHLQQVYKDLGYKPGDFPVAERVQDEILALPMYPELSRSQMDEVIAALKEAL